MSQIDTKRKTYDIRTWQKKYFSTYPPPTLIPMSHRFTSVSEPAAYNSFGRCLSYFRTFVSASSSAKRLHQGGFQADHTDGSRWGPP
jgi:hypothetical protein